MALNEDLLEDFDQELAHTRTVLQRVPQDRMGWRPHPKSWTLGTLANHLVWLPTWVPSALLEDSRDLDRQEGRLEIIESKQALLDLFDWNVDAARRALAACSGEGLHEPWSLRRGSRILFTLPRERVIRTYVLNHIIHHRAQLGVYLRMNDVPLPPIYGPSADEGVMD